MDYETFDGNVVDDEMLSQEAELFERGERPEVWEAFDSRSVSLTLPEWVVAEADVEAARMNVSRRAILNIWLAKSAEQSCQHRQSMAAVFSQEQSLEE